MILFRTYHIPLIRAGEKTETRRIWKPRKARPLPGSVHMAAAPCMVPDDADYGSPMFLPKADCTCFIRIDDDYGREADREPLGAMTDADARLEGDYETVADFRETWVDIHGEWDPEQVVDPVPFSYFGRRWRAELIQVFAAGRGLSGRRGTLHRWDAHLACHQRPRANVTTDLTTAAVGDHDHELCDGGCVWPEGAAEVLHGEAA